MNPLADAFDTIVENWRIRQITDALSRVDSDDLAQAVDALNTIGKIVESDIFSTSDFELGTPWGG
jgi:hypothetical protein